MERHIFPPPSRICVCTHDKQCFTCNVRDAVKACSERFHQTGTIGSMELVFAVIDLQHLEQKHIHANP